MNFSTATHLRALFWLSLFHVVIILASNYLVQYPFTLFGFHTTWGAFSFPFIFLATDLTVRVFGASLARRIIFWVMLPALFVSYTVSTLFFDTQWQGWASLQTFNLQVARIALASFLAYSLGQLMDVQVFDRLRQNAKWWVAPTASMFLGNLVDTFVFFFVAFYRSSNEFLAAHWVEVAWVDYIFKILICLVFFLPVYGVVLAQILKRIVPEPVVHAR